MALRGQKWPAQPPQLSRWERNLPLPPGQRGTPIAILLARAERWQSGRMRRLAKAVSLYGFRGFESLPLRHSSSSWPVGVAFAPAGWFTGLVKHLDAGPTAARTTGRNATQACLWVTLSAGASLLTGCRGDRILRIESVPSGATVRLDDRVIGRTPLEIDFKDYGQRRLALYKETYRTYSEPLILKAPWWARFPVDLLTEVVLPLRLHDVREARIVLAPDAGEEEATVATQEFIEHALRARSGDRFDEAADAEQP